MPGVVAGHKPTTSTTTTTTTTVNPSDPITLEGFGAAATGANTPTIYHVTTLSGTGPGSLAYGLGLSSGSTAPTGKTIVFDVAGTITGRHTVTNGSFFTIDGTTAPYPGITITSPSQADALSLEGSGVHHVIVKGLSFINSFNDGMNVVDGAHDVMITNCTAYGNADGNIDLSATLGQNVTMQWCIIGWHVNTCHCGSGGAGGTLVTSKFISVHHNLFFPISPNPDEGERFPFVHASYSPAADPNADIRNNLIYRYGRSNATGSGYGVGVGYGAHVNIVNNYFYTPSVDAGPDGVDLSIDGTTSSAYSAGNVSGNGFNFNATSRYTNHAEYSIPAQYQITGESACAAASRILAKAGITQRDGSGNRRPDEAAYINGVILPLTGC